MENDMGYIYNSTYTGRIKDLNSKYKYSIKPSTLSKDCNNLQKIIENNIISTSGEQPLLLYKKKDNKASHSFDYKMTKKNSDKNMYISDGGLKLKNEKYNAGYSNTNANQNQNRKQIKSLRTYLESINITEDCYILTQPINSNFIKLFELDCVTQSKCIIINRNSEISLILEDHIEFLTKEMINFYLNTRNSQYTNDYFTKENKDELKSILQKDEFKNILENFSQNFNLEIEFKEIENKKYPVNIHFMYHQKDAKNAEQILTKLEHNIKSKIKKYFIGQNIIKDKSLADKIELRLQKDNKISIFVR